MKLSLFDLHCDTAYEMIRQNQPLGSNHLAISLENAEKFDSYTQVMAFWTPSELSDEDGFDFFQRAYRNLQNDPSVRSGDAILTTKIQENSNATSLLLAVEDARILGGRIERVDLLWSMGIRFLTPLWKGVTSIGGAHDTNEGLSPFGKSAVARAMELGMIPDVSHASVRSADEIFEIGERYERPIVATHSNAYDICPASRNLHRSQIERILKCDGLVGLNLYRYFIRSDGNAATEDLIPHIAYFLEHGMARNLALGCDMDGAELPRDIPDLSALPHLAERLLAGGYSEDLVRDLFYRNARRFCNQYLK